MMSQRLRLLPALGLLLAAPLLLTTPACKSEEARPDPTPAFPAPPAPPPLPEAAPQQPEPAQPAQEPAQAAAESPAQLFSSLGCPACHRPGSAWYATLVRSRDKPVEQVARFILTPGKFRPGTMMPAYDGRITEEQALSLARWIKAGNP